MCTNRRARRGKNNTEYLLRYKCDANVWFYNMYINRKLLNTYLSKTQLSNIPRKKTKGLEEICRIEAYTIFDALHSNKISDSVGFLWGFTIKGTEIFYLCNYG